jgi:hypothetical protein
VGTEDVLSMNIVLIHQDVGMFIQVEDILPTPQDVDMFIQARDIHPTATQAAPEGTAFLLRQGPADMFSAERGVRGADVAKKSLKSCRCE